MDAGLVQSLGAGVGQPLGRNGKDGTGEQGVIWPGMGVGMGAGWRIPQPGPIPYCKPYLVRTTSAIQHNKPSCYRLDA